MIDKSTFLGIVWGSAATIALLLLLAAFGHLPTRTEPRYSCPCPDSGTFVSPRSLEPKERN